MFFPLDFVGLKLVLTKLFHSLSWGSKTSGGSQSRHNVSILLVSMTLFSLIPTITVLELVLQFLGIGINSGSYLCCPEL